MPVTLSFSSTDYQPKDHSDTAEFSDFKINEGRLAKLVFGEEKSEATSLSAWNKFSLKVSSWFSCSSSKPLDTKVEGMKALYDLINTTDGKEGTNCYDRLKALAELAGPEHGAQFKLRLSEKEMTAELFIDGVAVAKRKVTEEHFIQMQAQTGQVQSKPVYESSVMALENHKKETAELSTLSDTNFSGGGVNKKFDGSTGVLKGMNNTATADFELETKLAKYAKTASNATALDRYISLQVKIEPKDLPTEGLDTIRPYASVTMYDSSVKSKELDVCLPNPVLSASSDPRIRAKGLPAPSNMLLPNEKKAVATQLVDMLRVMYNSKVSHRDLHSHNLLVHRFEVENEDGIKEPVTMLKAIDFGRAKYGEEDFEAHKFEDIRYIFNREGASKGETFARNTVLPTLINPTNTDQNTEQSDLQAKLAKHYPMHNLLPTQGGRERSIDILLANIGNTLVSELEAAGKDQSKIDTAFFNASQAIENAFSDTRSINVTSLV